MFIYSEWLLKNYRDDQPKRLIWFLFKPFYVADGGGTFFVSINR